MNNQFTRKQKATYGTKTIEIEFHKGDEEPPDGTAVLVVFEHDTDYISGIGFFYKGNITADGYRDIESDYWLVRSVWLDHTDWTKKRTYDVVKWCKIPEEMLYPNHFTY